MNEIYKVVTKAEDYPNCARAVKLEKGDGFYLVGSRDVRVGDKYEGYPAIVSRIDYKPKKWWQFWKKKEMIGCQILWLGDEDKPSETKKEETVKKGYWEQGDMYDIGDVCSLCGYDSGLEPCHLSHCPSCHAEMKTL